MTILEYKFVQRIVTRRIQLKSNLSLYQSNQLGDQCLLRPAFDPLCHISTRYYSNIYSPASSSSLFNRLYSTPKSFTPLFSLKKKGTINKTKPSTSSSKNKNTQAQSAGSKRLPSFKSSKPPPTHHLKQGEDDDPSSDQNSYSSDRYREDDDLEYYDPSTIRHPTRDHSQVEHSHSKSASSDEAILPLGKFGRFNYKTFRYKDLMFDYSDMQSIIDSPLNSRASRSNESSDNVTDNDKQLVLEEGSRVALIENPHGDQVSSMSTLKDVEPNSPSLPVGLSTVPVPYVSQVLKAVYNVIINEKGQDIVAIDIEHKTNWVPNIIITTAMSPRHCLSISRAVQAELKRLRLCKHAKIDRNEGDEWVIVSTGTTIVQIMVQSTREYMDLERLWVLKRSAQETFEFDEEEDRFMYDEEDGLWDEEGDD